MKTLRQHGPLSVRALAKQLERDYKNVHADANALEEVDLIQRTEERLLVALGCDRCLCAVSGLNGC